jgi:phage tail sheath protein FI
VSNSDYIGGLTALEGVDVNFVLCAGQSDNSLHSSMNAHCQDMANQNKERIAIAGSAALESIATIMARTVKSDRFVFVSPGVVTTDLVTGNDVTLAGAYSAAAVAGMCASRDVQTSITNQTLTGVSYLEDAYTDSELKQLLLDNRCPIKIKNGIRVARGITTSTNSAWQQITTRRIVDYVKAGVRNAGDQFIGSLNNERVRSSLKGVIDAFCNDLVDNEVLIAFKSEVTATRADEIAGVCKVTLQIQPVFSIDFIEVTIYLS